MKLRAALSLTRDWAIVALLYWPRYLFLRLAGYQSANPRFVSYKYSQATAAAGVAEITAKLGTPRFGTVLDHGCGNGRNARVFRKIASRVYGTDIIAPGQVSDVDRYIYIDPASKAPLAELPDGSVDAVFALNYCGFNTHSIWRSYFSVANERLAVYLEPQNFHRILSPSGLLIFSEWEAVPEARWGKASLAEIEQDASSKYDPPEISGFELVVCGFAKSTRSPFVVYRRV